MPAEPTEVDDGAPWHDPAMALSDRMKLAEGRPLQRRMMAAMAQQDCGQCGYNCHDYSKRSVRQKEERLNLCVPGGKNTTRMLKQLYEEIDRAPAAAKPAAVPQAEKPALPLSAPGRSEIIRHTPRSCRADDRTSLVRKKTRGISSSTLLRPVSTTRSEICLEFFRQ